MTGVSTREVGADDAGVRLDRWFRRHFPDLAHGQLEKLLRKGQIRVDGARAKANQRLDVGQRIRVPPLRPAADERPKRTAPKVTAAESEMLQQAVLHRDDAVLVIDKPAGLAVQGGTGTARHLDAMLDALTFDARERPRLVHRLDKDTSGVLILGRTARAAAALSAAFKARATEKIYWAIVCGRPAQREGTITAPLAKGGGPGKERVFVDPDGQRAVTDYVTVDTAHRQAAWLALRPVTGRTHQLRAHCAYLGTPILGDGKYGGQEAFLSGLPLDRQLHLHARRISIANPAGGRLTVEAPIPAHFQRSMVALGFDVSAYQDPFVDEAPAQPRRRRRARQQ